MIYELGDPVKFAFGVHKENVWLWVKMRTLR